jgi:hypothetical protein
LGAEESASYFTETQKLAKGEKLCVSLIFFAFSQDILNQKSINAIKL